MAVNPQLMAMLQAMAQNPNADRGGPILGGHPGQQTLNSMPDASGQVQGGDGARYPRTEPGTGFVPAPGENPAIGTDWAHEGEDDPRTWDPQANNTSLLGPHGTNIGGLLAGMNALVNPGTYNTRHPLTLMRQIHPGLIQQPTKSGGAFGPVDQARTSKQTVLQQLLANR